MIALLLLGSGVAGVGYFVLKPWAAHLQLSLEADLQGGASELQQGTDAIHRANQNHDPTQLDLALAHFAASRTRFEHASSQLQGDWTLRQAARVPVFGPSQVAPRVTVVTQVAAMGVALGDAGRDTAAVDRQLLAPGNKDLPAGQRLLGVLSTTGPALTKIQVDLARADSAAGLVNAAFLPAAQRQTFSKARGQIQSGLAGIAEFQRLSPVLLEILGANGARTYLIEQVDPAELRGGGGFIGSYSLLSADHGVLKLTKSGDTGLIDYPYPVKGGRKYIAPPNTSLQFTQHGWVFGDANFLPDFTTSSATSQALFKNETGAVVDGVISMDPEAVAALLKVTGPIPIPEYKTTADAATFAEQVFQREEKLSAIVPGKKNFFPAVADRLIERISSLSSEGWPNLLNALNSVIQSRHLQVAFNNQTAQEEMARINWAGAVVAPSPDRETMLEVESNFSGNKSNHFIERSYDLSLVADNGKLHHHLVINLKNSTPDGYAGGRQYTCYLRFYYPASVTDLTTKSLVADRFPSDEKPAGLKLADGWFNIEINNLALGYATYQVTMDYTTDLGDLASGHAIYWQKQPGTLNDKVHVTFQSSGKSFTADSDLGQDRILTLSPRGVEVTAGNVAAAHLPILGT